jgi:peptidoglycan/xylan/chitin deacetylase (PgdA/CDA1 family)
MIRPPDPLRSVRRSTGNPDGTSVREPEGHAVGQQRRPGALIISLDFEIHWGVRHLFPIHGNYRNNLLGEWEVVPRILGMFREYEVAATWATVGFLFALNREELQGFSPVLRPEYLEASLSPYREPLGSGENEDPLHYAPSLIEEIRATPRQEVATHTFSHYFCREPGQTRETFAADLQSAITIAEQRGVQIRSIAFPLNQHNPEYDDLLVKAGIICYRGNQRSWMYRASGAAGQTPWKRAARLLDAYVNVSGRQTMRWEDLANGCDGICNLPASFHLRPFSPRLRHLQELRFQRIAESIRRAAAEGEVVHLWWHPHDFGVHQQQNLDFLRRLLEEWARQRQIYGMQSLSMAEAATLVLRECSGHAP